MKNPFRKYENLNDCKNDIEFVYFYTKILEMFCNRFKWNNLPEYIPPYFLEQTLFFRANAAFIYDKNAEMFAVMKTNLTGLPDIYNIPSIREVYAVTGYLQDYTKDNSVLIWDNYSKFPFYYKAVMYAKILANAWKTREMNMFAQRTPFILKSPKDQKLSYAEIGSEYTNMIPIIRIDETIDMKNLEVLNLDSPWLVPGITTYMKDVWSQILTDLGYESNPVEKKERLITDEVAGNNGEAEANRNIGLDLRNRACNSVNKLWGLNLSVEFNSNMKTTLNVAGGDEDESLDNSSVRST